MCGRRRALQRWVYRPIQTQFVSSYVCERASSRHCSTATLLPRHFSADAAPVARRKAAIARVMVASRMGGNKRGE